MHFFWKRTVVMEMPVHACMLSHFSRVRHCATPWTVPSRFLCPWDSSGKSSGAGYCGLFQGNVCTQYSFFMDIHINIAFRFPNFNTLTTSCKELTYWKRPWCWEGLEAGGEEDDRGWDGWMVSPTRPTWVWVNSGSWWWTGRPSMLRFMGSQRVGHDWPTKLTWTDKIRNPSERLKMFNGRYPLGKTEGKVRLLIAASLKVTAIIWSWHFILLKICLFYIYKNSLKMSFEN